MDVDKVSVMEKVSACREGIITCAAENRGEGPHKRSSLDQKRSSTSTVIGLVF
jgi:hypothetical protein